MFKHISLIISLFLPLFVHAQIEKPVTWSFSNKAVSTNNVQLKFNAKIDKDWHIYATDVPEGGPIATSLKFNKSADYELIGKVNEVTKSKHDFDATFSMNIGTFEKQAILSQNILLKKSEVTISGTVEYMACNDMKCLPPEEVPFTFTIKQTAQENSATIVNENLKPENQSDTAKNAILAKKDTIVQQAVVEANTQNSNSTNKSLWAIFIAGFLGGLAALIMPCIFPMLPLTVSFFTKKSGSRKKAISSALWYGFFIIAIYVALGLLITVIFGADALNDLSTNGIFNFFFFILLVVFAFSFLGAFELTLPSSWINKMDAKSEKGGWGGLFFMAATLALVSFSCTGPIIGTLLVQAASMGALLGPAIGMLGFAIALALPFALFALFPSWLKSLPKSGGWLNSVKVILGFLELAFALKFLSNVDLAYHWNWFDREIFLALWIVISALMGFYLLGKLKLPNDSDLKHVSTPRLTLAIITLAFTVYMIPGMWGAPLKSIAAFLPPQHTQDFDLYSNAQGGNIPQTHTKKKYSDLFHAPLNLNVYFDLDEGLAYAKEVNKPVLIDFTGHNCVNCRKMEAVVWSDKEVLNRLSNNFVIVQLYVDDKTELPDNEQYISSFSKKKIKTIGNKWSDIQASKYNANSQPFYVMLNTKGEVLLKPEGANYNPDEFAQFLDKAVTAYNQSK
jgi:thiol:disulfide interchange protein DsbD